MNEAERRLRAQDLGPDQLAGRRGRRALVAAGQRRDRPERRALPEHRRRARDGAGVGRQPREPQQHGARDRARADRAHHAGLPAPRLHALGLERAEQLAQQQRVAAGRLVAGGAERRVGAGAEALAHELIDRGEAQRPRAQRERRGVAGDLAEQRRVGRRLAGAQRGGDERGDAVEPAGEVGEEAQRRAVAPVQVVDREQQRPLGGEVEREPEEPVQRGERRAALASASGAAAKTAAAGAAAPLERGRVVTRRPSASNSWRTTP